MNYKLTITLALAIGLYGCQQEAEQATATHKTDVAPTTTNVGDAPAAVALVSGIDQSGFDKSVRPQDNLFDSINGGWVKNT